MNRQASTSEKSPELKRQYGCPCGKTYLSYPALFTHVKHKHDGKPPGSLIKPETGKIRGRPKTRVNSEELEMVAIAEASHRSIRALLQAPQPSHQPLQVPQPIHQHQALQVPEASHQVIQAPQASHQVIQAPQASHQVVFAPSEGSETCQDAATKFLEEFADIESMGMGLLTLFLNKLRASVNRFYGHNFWEEEGPGEIIEVANRLFSREEDAENRLPEETLKGLTFNFFEWLFANKLTDHRLLRKAEDK